MNIQTRIKKDIRNMWKAESVAMITEDLQLSVTTRKMSNGELVTNASVSKLEGNFHSHVMYQDFSRRVRVTSPKRVTSKVVEAQHALVDFEQVAVIALGFYGIEA
jgi:hypothetical protein